LCINYFKRWDDGDTVVVRWFIYDTGEIVLTVFIKMGFCTMTTDNGYEIQYLENHLKVNRESLPDGVEDSFEYVVRTIHKICFSLSNATALETAVDD
jgi:hypothetical protein